MIKAMLTNSLFLGHDFFIICYPPSVSCCVSTLGEALCIRSANDANVLTVCLCVCVNCVAGCWRAFCLSDRWLKGHHRGICLEVRREQEWFAL